MFGDELVCMVVPNVSLLKMTYNCEIFIVAPNHFAFERYSSSHN